jgi:2-oxoglutarate dehydrogenase E2 component (dihydrolipoamide succinyltransferase)
VSTQTSLVEIVMPQLGVSVADGTLVAWRKRAGDEVEADEALCDVASDKVDSEIPAPCRGCLTALLVAEGETVAVGSVIATLETGRPQAPAPERHSPVVLRLAAEHGVDLATIVGTGQGGRVRKEDVLAAAAPAAPAVQDDAYQPPPPGELSRMRRLIGEHTKRSLETAATVTSWIEVDFSAVEQRRRALGLTALPLVAEATVATLAEYGELNAWLDGDAYTRHSDVNLGIAVTLGERGLVAPVIRAAQRLDAAALAARIVDLAARARDGRLSPDELRGGTFTLTNPGQFGTVMATPVISQPEVAILDMEAIVRRPVVVTGADGAEEIAIRPICVLGLSWDHRALDGAYAARFLAALRARLEG